MPGKTLTYYFSLQSPWSYLGHAELMRVVARHELRLVWKPVNLLAIFPESGGLPLAKRHPTRVAYRSIELQRWRELRRLPLKLKPAFWPTDVTLADSVVVALAADGDPDPFVRGAFAALWAEDRDVADRATLKGLLQTGGYDAAEALARATSETTADAYRSNVAEALRVGAFGAPTYVLDGEPFWGQDRIDLLDQCLTSGRAPLAS